MQNEIRNIIFDLGNIINLDLDRINKAFQKIIGHNFTQIVTSDATYRIFNLFETRHYSEDSFINALQRLAPKVPDAREVIDAWNSMLLEIPPQRLKMLDELKRKGYQLYVLSNTNSLHLRHFRKHLKKSHGITDFDERYFVRTYYSHLVKMRKPDQEIFDYVLGDAFIKAEETLFVNEPRLFRKS